MTDKRYRDARTSEYVTAEYAAEHPDTTVSEERDRRPTSAEASPPESGLTPETLSEPRRLLEKANPSRDHYEVHPGFDQGFSVETWDGWSIATCAGKKWAQLIAAAVNALPSLLDELDHLETDVAEAEGDAQRYWPFVERAERAEAALARVRELHERESFWQYHRDQEHSYPTQQDAADDSGCDCPEDPESTYLAHTPECLATITHFDVCAECARIEYADADRQAHGEFSGYAEALWPCPTIRALGGGES